MPSYDYRCHACHLQFSVRHPVGERISCCPECGNPVEKVILCAPAFHGAMARGREMAVRSLEPPAGSAPAHGPGCGCCHHAKS